MRGGCYNPSSGPNQAATVLEEIAMGTCPNCKLRIRKNGNHVKLGSVWKHKICPTRKRAAAAK